MSGPHEFPGFWALIRHGVSVRTASRLWLRSHWRAVMWTGLACFSLLITAAGLGSGWLGLFAFTGLAAALFAGLWAKLF